MDEIDPRRKCMNCEVGPAKYLCTRCGFVSFCCVEHQKQSWSFHKKFCEPLDTGVKDAFERARRQLRKAPAAKMPCIYCNKASGELHSFGCSCGDSAHIGCFQGAIRKAFIDPKRRDSGFYCGGLDTCDKCKMQRQGILRLELALELWQLRDRNKVFVSSRTKEYNSGYEAKEAFCTVKVLASTLTLSADSAQDYQLRLRLNYKLLDLIQGSMQTSADGQIMLTSEVLTTIAMIYKQLYKFKLGMKMLRYNLKQLHTLNESPERLAHTQRTKCALASLLIDLSDFEVKKASKREHLTEAEALMRAVVAQNKVMYNNQITAKTLGDRAQLARAVTLQERVGDACDILDECINDASRVFGDEHPVTKGLLALLEAEEVQKDQIPEKVYTNFTQETAPSHTTTQ